MHLAKIVCVMHPFIGLYVCATLVPCWHSHFPVLIYFSQYEFPNIIAFLWSLCHFQFVMLFDKFATLCTLIALKMGKKNIFFLNFALPMWCLCVP